MSDMKILHLIYNGPCLCACDVCNETFNYKSNLKKHRRIHSGQCLYVCDVFNKIFSQKLCLEAHQHTLLT